MLRTLLVAAVWLCVGAPACAIALCRTLLTRDASMLYRWGVRISTFGLRLAGVRTEVTFASPLPPDRPCLFLANHASILDPPLLAGALLPRRVPMVIKRELLNIPLLGVGFRLAGYVAVARTGSVEDAKHSLEQSRNVLRSNLSLAIFVEGTRSPDGRLLPFKKGPFFLAESCDVPVVPVTVAGTSGLLPKNSRRLRGGVVRITVHEPLDPKAFATRDQLSAAVRTAIASALPPRLTGG